MICSCFTLRRGEAWTSLFCVRVHNCCYLLHSHKQIMCLHFAQHNAHLCHSEVSTNKPCSTIMNRCICRSIQMMNAGRSADRQSSIKESFFFLSRCLIWRLFRKSEVMTVYKTNTNYCKNWCIYFLLYTFNNHFSHVIIFSHLT